MRIYDDCFYCGGRVSSRYVQKPCWWSNQLIAIVNDVPVGVCEQCGERHYEGRVLRTLERLLKHKELFKTKIKIPIANYAKT